MARPGKYGSDVHEAIWAARTLSAEKISEAAARGELAGLEPFEIPKRTVAYHLARMRRERPAEVLEPGTEDETIDAIHRSTIASMKRQAKRFELWANERPLTVQEQAQQRELLRTIESVRQQRRASGKRQAKRTESEADEFESRPKKGLLVKLKEEAENRSALDVSPKGLEQLAVGGGPSPTLAETDHAAELDHEGGVSQ